MGMGTGIGTWEWEHGNWTWEWENGSKELLITKFGVYTLYIRMTTVP